MRKKSHDMLSTMESENELSKAALLALLQQSQQDNQQLRELLQSMQQQIDKLQRMLFGQSSERKPSERKNTDKDDKEKKSSSKKTRQNKQANGRRRIPKALPRSIVEHDLPENEKTCSHCHTQLKYVDKDISEQLEFIPAKLLVIEHHRSKYSCTCCGTITMAPMPAQAIDKCLAGPGLLAETLISKYQDHLPLHRQEQRYERYGYTIPRSTLCDWVSACAFVLKPLVDAMSKAILKSPKIHSDDTTLSVLDKEKTHTGRLWVYVGGGGDAPPITVYRYTKTRSGQEPQGFLSEYQGYLQADAYAGYDKCYESGDIIEVACLAHARRKFVDAQKLCENDVLVDEAITRMAALYEIETQAKDMSEERRYYYRKRHSKPKLKHFYKWLKRIEREALPKSPLGKAIYYALNHWPALCNYLRDGVLEIDNNRAERAMRSIAIGRKNYLFAGSHEGAKRAAIIYSLIESCKALEINTFDYLKDVLGRLPTTLNKDIDSLLPHNWLKDRENAVPNK